LSSIILIDDSPVTRNNISQALTGAGHTVLAVPEDTKIGFLMSLTHQFQETPDNVWDFLVLDIQYGSSLYGGIWLYNDLVAGNYRKNWRHTLIYSRHVADRPEEATSGEALVLRVFVETARIPYLDYCVNSYKGGRQELLTRIQHLGPLPREPFCNECQKGL
jgi:hypothetical protein